jgi:hypothetical protein
MNKYNKSVEKHQTAWFSVLKKSGDNCSKTTSIFIFLNSTSNDPVDSQTPSRELPTIVYDCRLQAFNTAPNLLAIGLLPC